MFLVNSYRGPGREGSLRAGGGRSRAGAAAWRMRMFFITLVRYSIRKGVMHLSSATHPRMLVLR